MNADKEAEITEISVEELQTRLQKDPKLCIIDVREQDEWDRGHLPSALHVPKDDLKEKIEGLVPNKKHAIYLHCQAGRRSAIAAAQLMEAGYQEVYSVAGGFGAWRERGYGVV